MYGCTGPLNPINGRTSLGPLNPMYGKVPTHAFQSGPNNPMYGRTGPLNPMYGKVPANAMTINIYSLDGKLINSFSSQVAAAEWLSVTQATVSNYIKSGKESEQSIYLSKI